MQPGPRREALCARGAGGRAAGRQRAVREARRVAEEQVLDGEPQVDDHDGRRRPHPPGPRLLHGEQRSLGGQFSIALISISNFSFSSPTRSPCTRRRRPRHRSSCLLPPREAEASPEEGERESRRGSKGKGEETKMPGSDQDLMTNYRLDAFISCIYFYPLLVLEAINWAAGAVLRHTLIWLLKRRSSRSMRRPLRRSCRW